MTALVCKCGWAREIPSRGLVPFTDLRAEHAATGCTLTPTILRNACPVCMGRGVVGSRLCAACTGRGVAC